MSRIASLSAPSTVALVSAYCIFNTHILGSDSLQENVSTADFPLAAEELLRNPTTPVDKPRQINNHGGISNSECETVDYHTWYIYFRFWSAMARWKKSSCAQPLTNQLTHMHASPKRPQTSQSTSIMKPRLAQFALTDTSLQLLTPVNGSSVLANKSRRLALHISSAEVCQRSRRFSVNISWHSSALGDFKFLVIKTPSAEIC